MKKSILNFLFFAINLLIIFGSGKLQAGPIDSTASLTFHLDQLIEKFESADLEIIPFSEEEENSLWNNVLSDEDSNEALYLAYFDFLEGKKYEAEGSNEEAVASYRKAFDVLSSHWTTLKAKECFAEEEVFSKSPTYNDFETNPYITDKARGLIRPFLLPLDHPMHSNMDQIFQPTRVVQDLNSFRNAGFEVLYVQPRSFIVVGRHSLLPNYLVKANLDSGTKLKDSRPAWRWFVYRCVGARKVADIISKYNITHCVTPNKYIYPLPADPSPPDSRKYLRKIIVLLVDDMHLVDKKTNILYWETEVTKEHLNELYIIITRANGKSYRPDNIPFTVNKQIAFIDTEYPTASPDYKNIRKYLSKSMRAYWDKLVRNGGP